MHGLDAPEAIEGGYSRQAVQVDGRGLLSDAGVVVRDLGLLGGVGRLVGESFVKVIPVDGINTAGHSLPRFRRRCDRGDVAGRIESD